MTIALINGTCPTCRQETLPVELPEGSVVLDKDGDSWQRRIDGWNCADGDYLGYTWLGLLGLTNRDFVVLYTPEESV